MKRQFDTFVWSCASINPTPFKQEYGGGTRGRVIQFIKKKTIPRCHSFHFGTAFRNNNAFILACTVMNFKASMFPCVFHVPVGMFFSHTNAFLIASLLLILFFNHYSNIFFLALDTSIYYINIV